MPWTSMLPRAATTSASIAEVNTLQKNAKNQSCSAANANSSAVVTRRTAPIKARVAVRLTVPRQKKAQPPGMRLKALKRKKTRARAVIGPSPYKECPWMKQELDSRIMKSWLQSWEKPKSEAPIWVC